MPGCYAVFALRRLFIFPLSQRFFISSERRFLPSALMRRRPRLVAEPARRLVKLDSIAESNKPIALSPANPAFHLVLGITLAEVQRHDEAIAEYRQALAEWICARVLPPCPHV